MSDPSVNPVTAIYISETTFTVEGNYVSNFHTDRRIRARCGAFRKHGTILSSSYNAGVTTVILTTDSDDLNSDLDGVWLGELSAPSNGDSSLPKHLHTAEDLGGVLSSYATDAEVTVISGVLQNQIDSLSLDHNDLNNLDYASSGHTGFASSIDLTTLSGNLITSMIWESVDTPTEQIRPKTAYINKAMYHGGNFTIGGNLTVSGTTTTVNSEEVTVADKTLTLNYGEAGNGVTGSSLVGIEVDRGLETNYFFMFDESDDYFKVGISGTLQAVATREDSPTDNYVVFWNNSEKRFDTSGSINISNIWHSGNDGTGSGLDSDLLDGQEGSYYEGLVTAHINDNDNPHNVDATDVLPI